MNPTRIGSILVVVLMFSCGSELDELDPHGEVSSALTTQVTRAFQEGVAPTSSYAGTRDTYLMQSQSTTAHGAETTVRVDGDDPNGGSLDDVALLKWDISSIPVGSTIQSARIVLQVTNASGDTYSLVASARAWTEGATWFATGTGAAWQQAGATASSDLATTALGSVTAPALGQVVISLNTAGIGVIKHWVDTPSTNNGLALVGRVEHDGLLFASRESSTASQRPRLEVTYSTLPAFAGTRLVAVEQATDRVIAGDLNTDWNQSANIVWSWSAANSPQISSGDRGYFLTPSDVKIKNGGKTMIVSASGGGVAIVNVADKATTFYAIQGGNPHAVELLPNGFFAAASSDGFIRVYNTSTRSYAQASASFAHGLYWDNAHGRLLALANDRIKAYSVGFTSTPTLTEIGSWTMPNFDNQGHDLFPIAGTSRLFVTTQLHIWEFDVNTNSYSATTTLSDRPYLKSVGKNPVTGQIAYTVPVTSWYTDHITLIGPSGTQSLSGGQLYKARWWWAE